MLSDSKIVSLAGSAERKERKPAFVIRKGSSVVQAYGPDERDRYTLTYYRFVGDKRNREKKTGEASARKRAKEIATDLANGRAEVLELTHADRESYMHAKAMLPEGISLHEVVEQFVNVRRRLGTTPISSAVESFLQIPTVNGSRATVRVLVQEFMRRKRTAMLNGDRSALHIKDLTGVLEGKPDRESAFLREFGDREIISIRPEELQDWLNERRDLKGRVVGPRRRRNIRAAIVELFNDARKNLHLRQGVNHAAELTDCPKPIKGKEPTFEPEQFDILIRGAHNEATQCELVPAFAIGAFGRMRMSEIARLEWPAIALFDQEKPGQHHPVAGEIDVSGKIAGKTGMPRIIEITPNLAAWLRPYARAGGHVLNPKITRIDNKVRRFSQKLGLKWKRNVLRGSSTSYLYAWTNDISYVAAQHGTSERELKREYLERKTFDQAQAWYAISPPHADDKILELRWSVHE
jgi:hypothetical protein